MTCFTTRGEARASMLARTPALCGRPSRHANQQSWKSVRLDAEVIRRSMWRKSSDPDPNDDDDDDAPRMWSSLLNMEMTEEEYDDLPRSNKVERKAAKAFDTLKCGCAQAHGAWAG